MSSTKKSVKQKTMSPQKSMFSDQKSVQNYEGLESVPADLKDTIKFLISRKVELRLKEEMDTLRAQIRAELGHQ